MRAEWDMNGIVLENLSNTEGLVKKVPSLEMNQKRNSERIFSTEARITEPQ